MNNLSFIQTFFGRSQNTWWLDGKSMVDWCVNRHLPEPIEIGVVGWKPEDVRDRCTNFGTEPKIKNGLILLNGIKIYLYEEKKHRYYCAGKDWERSFPKDYLKAPENIIQAIQRKRGSIGANGLWRVRQDVTSATELPVPYKCGSILDLELPLWWKDIKHEKVMWNINDIFMCPRRCKSAFELIEEMYKCAEKAGFSEKMYLGFGGLLGYVRHGNFVPNDRDLDMCIKTEGITLEQQEAYIKEVKKRGLDKARWRPPERRSDNSHCLWFSLGKRNPVSDYGIKSCNWWTFNHDGYEWHSKGRQWISPLKFNNQKVPYSDSDSAICKGMPDFIAQELVNVSWSGCSINFPKNAGSALDTWYPGWHTPAGGASAHTNLLIVGNWGNKNTWRRG